MSSLAINPYLRAKVDYIRAVTKELVIEHREEYLSQKMKLTAAVLFGPLAREEYSEEIWLLEIVEGYPYPSKTPEPLAVTFRATKDFPLLGHLRLWAMSPDEFRDALESGHPFATHLRDEPKEFLLDVGGRARKLLG